MSAHGLMRRHPVNHLPRYSGGSPSVNSQRWRDPDFAPVNTPLAVQARDTLGPYTLPMHCIRTADRGWISAHTLTPLQVVVVGWRHDERGVR